MKISTLGHAALEGVTVDDSAYSAAIRTLRLAAPEHDALILALECAASDYALACMEAGFITGVSVATAPTLALWLA